MDTSLSGYRHGDDETQLLAAPTIAMEVMNRNIWTLISGTVRGVNAAPGDLAGAA
jgi:hypothetical protein